MVESKEEKPVAEEGAAAATETPKDSDATVTSSTIETTSGQKLSKEEKEIEQKIYKIISRMPAKTQDRFKALAVLSDQRSKINDQYLEECKQLNEEFEKKKEPILEIRNKILDGTKTDFSEYVPKFDELSKRLKEFTSSIVKDEEKLKEEEEEKAERKPFDPEPLLGKKGVPDFWKRAILNNQMMKMMIKEHDEPILDSLHAVKASYSQVPTERFSITMFFSTNDYFENESLSFTAYIADDTNNCREVEGEDIKWKDGKNVTTKKIKKTQKNKKTNEKRVIMKMVP